MTKYLLLSALVMLFLSACTSGSDPAVADKVQALEASLAKAEARIAELEGPTFVHTVFFWFKEDITEAEKTAFIEGTRKLAEIEGMYVAYQGEAAGTPREVVDNSYDYAFIAHFKDAAAQDAYQIDPIHEAFVKASSSLWTKVQVYDTIAE